MKGTNLGELEELVLLVVANLNSEAYGLAIRNFINERAGRTASISTIHATLQRLEKKGFVTSAYESESSGDRGGRPKLIFSITAEGEQALIATRQLREELWQGAPNFSSLNFSL